MVYSALRVREAREVVRREWACAGSPICRRLCNRLLGIALYGPFVSSWSALDSCLSVFVSGWTKEDFHASIGKDCWL